MEIVTKLFAKATRWDLGMFPKPHVLSLSSMRSWLAREVKIPSRVNYFAPPSCVECLQN